METRRLALLVELHRLGSMRAVAETLGLSTSSVSQQIAALATEAGTPLLQPDGRRVRLTPAGRRLAEHGVTVLAAVDAAWADLDPSAEPAGTVRVAGFASAVRRALLPAVTALSADHPRVRLAVDEHEPDDAVQLLLGDRIDLALIYDYDLAPLTLPAGLDTVRLWSTPWGLGVPAADPATGSSVDVFARYRDRPWIGNSRNDADETVLQTVGAMAGFAPRVAHRADSLDLVEDLIAAGLGVGLLSGDRRPRVGVRIVPLAEPAVTLRAYAATRGGGTAWPPLALVMRLLTDGLTRPA